MLLSAALFFGITTSLYFLLPHRFRWLFLLAASYIFYAAWNAPYVLVLALSTLVNYALARLIGSSSSAQQKNLYLTLDISLNVLLLFVFKYFGFFLASVGDLLQVLHMAYAAPALNILLPVGISFYTFQQMGYAFDVHRGRIAPERDLGLYALFVAFYPHVVSGPIGRAPALLPQFRQPVTFDEQRIIEGFRLILWGAFKKIVIADRLAVYVNAVYGNPRGYNSTVLLVATLFFAFQIYADFSGYTHMALGAAQVLGFRLMDNFRQPYFSQSIREFWQRWHISLSTWIRDYLFFPITRKALQISKGKFPRLIQLSISVGVMGLIGLWHGANWTFIVWGILHGLYLWIESLFSPQKGTETPLKNLTKITFTFALVCLTWIFFRANSLTDGLYIVSRLFNPFAYSLKDLAAPFEADLAASRSAFVLALLLIGVLLGADIVDARLGLERFWGQVPGPLRWLVYYSATAAILVLAGLGKQEFIYFKF